MDIEKILGDNEFLIASGRTGKVYKMEGNPESFVRKEFSPNYFAMLWNWFFFKSTHPLSTEIGHTHAYWKRILGNRLSTFVDKNVQIVDTITPSQNGFVSPFIEGRMPEKNEMQSIYAKTQKLEEVFDDIGMPTLSFSQRHFVSRRKNFILQNGRVFIIDYEQSVPVPDTKGNMGYDIIYFDDVHRFISNNRLQIIDKLGTDETRNLDEAFELSRQYQAKLDIRPRGLTRFSKPLSQGGRDRVVEILYKDGKISEKEFQDYKEGKTGKNIKLASMNLLIHSTIGVATPPYVGTPYSSGARLAWTLANWVYYTAIGDYNKRRIHNWRVMFVGALPLPFPLSFFSNGAYLLSIIEENLQIGLAINDSLLREFNGSSLEETMQLIGSKRIIKPIIRGYEALYHVVPNQAQEMLLGPNTKKAHDILLGYLTEGVKPK